MLEQVFQKMFFGFDTLVVDREDEPFALVQVKECPTATDWKSALPKQLATIRYPIPFVLAVDPNDILLFRWDGHELVGPIARLDTTEILVHYDPEYRQRSISKRSLLGFVERWLRNLPAGWSSETPPGVAELQGTGLLEKLDGGMTVSIKR